MPADAVQVAGSCGISPNEQIDAADDETRKALEAAYATRKAIYNAFVLSNAVPGGSDNIVEAVAHINKAIGALNMHIKHLSAMLNRNEEREWWLTSTKQSAP